MSSTQKTPVSALNVRAIREQMDEGNDRVDAILAIAKDDGRELTEDEQSEINAWHGEADEAGEYGKLESRLKQAEKIEARQKQIAQARMKEALDHVDDDGSQVIDAQSTVVVPARARRHGALKAFKGPDAARDAYVTGRWIMAKLLNDSRSQEWLDNHNVNATMTTDQATLGQELVPEPLEAAIIRMVEEYGVVRRFASPRTMTSGTLTIPSRLAGLTVYYPNEKEVLTASDMTFGNVKLNAEKYAVLAQLSTELDEDSIISVMDELAMDIAEAMAAAEDVNAFLGDGTPAFASVNGLSGKLTANSTVTAGGTTPDAILLSEFSTLKKTLPHYTGSQPVWYCNKSVYDGVMEPLMIAAGGTTGEMIADVFDAKFLGYPVVFANALPQPATGDFAAFLGTLNKSVYFGTRRGLSVQSDRSVYFTSDCIAVRATQRVATTVENNDAAKAGPMVGLKLA